jgi:hypothetical protein
MIHPHGPNSHQNKARPGKSKSRARKFPLEINALVALWTPLRQDLPAMKGGPACRFWSQRYFDAESFDSSEIASCTVVMNWAGKMMVEFFSTEISAIVCRVRS